MIQAIAAFSGGLWVQNKLSDLQLPQLSRRINEAETFKLSVQVVAASIPGLSDSGLLTRERPRVSALLNGVRKETEFGDCDADEVLALPGPGCEDLPPCDWQFNETLTFAVTVADVLAGQTVQLWIHTYSDVRFGPFQVNLTRARDVGVCSVELQKQVLPECVASEESGDSTRHQVDTTPRRKGTYSWETPVLPFPLTHVGGAGGAGDFVLGQAAGHLLVKFSMNADPQAMLLRRDRASRPLVERVADPFRQIIAAPVRWVETATEFAKCDGDELYCGVGRGYRESGAAWESVGELSDASTLGSAAHVRGRKGRASEEQPERVVSINGCVAGTEEDAVLRLPSKEKVAFKEGTHVFKLDLNKGAEATGSQPLARRSSRSLESITAAAPAGMQLARTSSPLEVPAGQSVPSTVPLRQPGAPQAQAPASQQSLSQQQAPQQVQQQRPQQVQQPSQQVQQTSQQVQQPAPQQEQQAQQPQQARQQAQQASQQVQQQTPQMVSRQPQQAPQALMQTAPAGYPSAFSSQSGTGSQSLQLYRMLTPPPTESQLPRASGHAPVMRQPTMPVIPTQKPPVAHVVRKGAEGSFVTVRPARATFAAQVPPNPLPGAQRKIRGAASQMQRRFHLHGIQARRDQMQCPCAAPLRVAPSRHGFEAVAAPEGRAASRQTSLRPALVPALALPVLAATGRRAARVGRRSWAKGRNLVGTNTKETSNALPEDKRISILGSTGSIGTQTLDICRQFPGRFKPVALAAGRNIELLLEQIKEFKPQMVACDESKLDELKEGVKALGIPDYEPVLLSGPEGQIEVARHPDRCACLNDRPRTARRWSLASLAVQGLDAQQTLQVLPAPAMDATMAPLVFIQMGGTIDKGYPRSLKGYAFEIGDPAAVRIAERARLDGDGLVFQSVCRKDSQEVTDEDRKQLLRCVLELKDKARVVVTHGTDTMITSAQALAAGLAAAARDLVVVFTGAMLPEEFRRSDADFNLGFATCAAQTAPRGVYVAMGGRLFQHDQVSRDEEGRFVGRFSLWKLTTKKELPRKIDGTRLTVAKILHNLLAADHLELIPTIEAIKAKKDIALANKETIIAGGPVIAPLIEEYGVSMLPVDSEHSAIFQCMQGIPKGGVKKIILTGSGGTFREMSLEDMKKEDPEVLRKRSTTHPNWDMGAKITVDSSTMMNKGLEVIEAHWLYGVDYDDIEVVIHPQSIVHSAVECQDTAILMQTGWPDMRLPILYALSHPSRVPADLPNPRDGRNFDDWWIGDGKDGKLTFGKPDLEKYPCIRLAYRAGRIGGTMPAILSAANEQAVELLLTKARASLVSLRCL
ncbi:unnamed protein product [Durusdinium trenchii]|uniref:1-deoxy-D-xylulose-5-phosphate reductoisomerase n=1 Tax=Durusdinium trenchii TaxID=1381693 RepID=A0ABP0NY27_9DINO